MLLSSDSLASEGSLGLKYTRPASKRYDSGQHRHAGRDSIRTVLMSMKQDNSFLYMLFIHFLCSCLFNQSFFPGPSYPLLDT